MRLKSSKKRAVAGASIVVAASLLILSGCEEAVETPRASEPTRQSPRPTPKPIVISEDANVVPPSTVLARVTDTTVTFAVPVQYARGDVLIVAPGTQAPRGLLRRVETVSADRRELTTSHATLGDVIESGTVEYNGALIGEDTPGRLLAAVAGPEDRASVISVCSTEGKQFTCPFPKVAFENSDGISLVVDGSLKIGVDGSIRVDVEDRKIESARGTFSVSEETNLRVQIATRIPSGVTETITGRNLEVELFRLSLPAIAFTVGPVPIWIEPTLRVYAGVDATGHLSVDVTHSGSFTTGAECPAHADCHRRSGWSRIAQSEGKFIVNSAVIGAEVRGYVSPDIAVTVWGFGMNASAEFYAIVGGEGSVENHRFTSRMYVEAGIDGHVGVVYEVPFVRIRIFEFGLARFAIVPAATIWETSAQTNRVPSFGSARVPDQTFTRGATIAPLILPRASGGDGTLSYYLWPVPPGLSFQSRSRTLSGRPTTADTYRVAYRVEDADRDSDTLTFTIAVRGKASTTGKIYWTDRNTRKIHRANLDGSEIEDIVTRVGYYPADIVLNTIAGKMYWTNHFEAKIQRANLDGSNVEDLVTSGLRHPDGIALDASAGKMYWTDFTANKIQRANLDGSNVEDLVTRGPVRPDAIVLDALAGKIYWTNHEGNSIQRANLDGTDVQDLITSGLRKPDGIALDVAANKMYWTEHSGRIRRANLDGSGVESLITTGLLGPEAIVLDIASGKMYWADYIANKIQRANLDGSNVEDVITGLGDPLGIALHIR